MPRILVMSSWVARGHVGLSGIVPVLQQRGFETIALPTVVLSNHLGHPLVAGGPVAVEQLEAMLAALDANGWLGEVDAVLTGYFPSRPHVTFARAAVERVLAHNPAAVICCDPVLGDDPGGLYVPADVAEAVKTDVLPLAHIATPNRFELAWLAGVSVGSPREAVAAARRLGVRLVLATSVPAGDRLLASVAVDSAGAFAATGPRLDGVPHGCGDVFSALFLAEHLAGRDAGRSLAHAAGGVGAMIAASLGADELRLVSTRELWTEPAAAAIETV